MREHGYVENVERRMWRRTRKKKNPDTEVTSGARQSRGLKIIHWNCDWMATKVDELAGLVREEKPDVVILQETKLREGDPTPHIEGYVVTRFDRKTRRSLAAARGGGLAVMMREGIAHWTEKHRGNSALEALIVNIPTGGRQGRLRIINIYIPPSGKTELKERERERSSRRSQETAQGKERNMVRGF